MKSFLAGLGIGLGLGMLFAPMSGEETRNNLRERANDLKDQAREAMNEGRERVSRRFEQVRGKAQDVASSMGVTGGKAGSEPATATGTEGTRNL